MIIRHLTFVIAMIILIGISNRKRVVHACNCIQDTLSSRARSDKRVYRPCARLKAKRTITVYPTYEARWFRVTENEYYRHPLSRELHMTYGGIWFRVTENEYHRHLLPKKLHMKLDGLELLKINITVTPSPGNYI